MKGLRKYLTPFAPDQSGAVGVLYELGGILVICDAGGCAGNVCGFDEPRWKDHPSAIFSAGLRDMDAILGRDERLVEKLADTAKKLEKRFAAIIGTPVPAVIATDFHALKRMAQKKTGLPILTVDSTGMSLYDVGEEKAWLELFSTFAEDVDGAEPGRIGILGATPLSASDLNVGKKLAKLLHSQGWNTVDCYGMGAGLERVRGAGKAEKNLVISTSALKTARLLERRFGTPYEIVDPLAERLLPDFDYQGRRVLIVHQQVTAHSLRNLLSARGAQSVTCATWFQMLPELTQEGDRKLREEEDFMELVRSENFDMIISDPTLWRMIPWYEGILIKAPHFALSGRLAAR